MNLLQNKSNTTWRDTDAGLKYGMAAFVGETSKLEFQIFGSSGFIDTNDNIGGIQNHQSFGVGILLTF